MRERERKREKKREGNCGLTDYINNQPIADERTYDITLCTKTTLLLYRVRLKVVEDKLER